MILSHELALMFLLLHFVVVVCDEVDHYLKKNRTIWNLNAISVPYLKIKRLNIADQISTFCLKKTKQKKQVGT